MCLCQFENATFLYDRQIMKSINYGINQQTKLILNNNFDELQITKPTIN